ncbi:hypothetical protein M441DRAFT_28229 [Trichoderma asperellum CBS 433.97]|uniref:Uncharacterized protein n=1 Tax=Trichoderma asperellum (strain ATCC 204424 / CBS 433.97 / NBRC 101777) TaxID=1042311 RepID=A0A2T3Z6F6_TRIA4|nr:hypothetical protein M441DRAFT_28229 [Trichoderma asperellum CBS 433.97]PTB40411.1 hypothetical protein M441DRAFT_28229 [Trichoderma asperellum CBS 433.97]
MAQAALEVARQRYPTAPWLEKARGSSYQPAEDDIIIETTGLLVVDEWNLKVNVMTSFIDSENPYALWLDSLAKGSTVEDELVVEYLHFLRQRDHRIKISNVRYIKGAVSDFQNEGPDSATIIPIRNEHAWSFAVAYPDCIHYYGNKSYAPSLISSGSRAVQFSWTGPKAQNEDESAIYTLLGIRRIQEGNTHLSQEAAKDIQHSFRIRMTVELLCEQIDPNDEKVRNLPSTIHKRRSVIDSESRLALESVSEPPEDAIIGWDEDRHSSEIPDFQTTSPNFDTPTPTHSPTSTRQSTRESHITNNSPMTSSQSRSRSSAERTTRSSLIPRARPHISNPIFFNDRKGILDLLCTAISVYRSTEASKEKSLLILWHLMKKRSVRNAHFASQFHERYNAVLFRHKMESFNDDDSALRSEMKHQADGNCISKMKKISSQCEFWKDLCNIGHEKWGEGKFVLLLAIPALSPDVIHQNRKHILSELRKRLMDATDPLESWLSSARQLCTSIIQRSLPEETLMIDLYHLKTIEDIDNNTYAAYVSLDPHVTMRLGPTVPYHFSQT